jgi:hypothetical protein
MIRVNSVDKSYFQCNACLSEDNLKNISFGIKETQTTSFRLCRECRNLLIGLLMMESEVADENN